MVSHQLNVETNTLVLHFCYLTDAWLWSPRAIHMQGSHQTFSLADEYRQLGDRVMFQGIKKAGHLVHLERPCVYNRCLKEFLAISTQANGASWAMVKPHPSCAVLISLVHFMHHLCLLFSATNLFNYLPVQGQFGVQFPVLPCEWEVKKESLVWPSFPYFLLGISKSFEANLEKCVVL